MKVFKTYEDVGELAWLALHADAELAWSAPDLDSLRKLANFPDDHPIVGRAKLALEAAKGHVYGDGKYKDAGKILGFRQEDFPGTEKIRLF